MDNNAKLKVKAINHKPKKTLVLYPFNQKFPTVYEPTIKLFYKNYNVSYSPPKQAKFYGLKENKIIRNTYYFVMNIFRKYIKSKIIKKSKKLDPKKNLLFCFNQLPPPEYDFIIDLEIVIGLSDYDYLKIDKKYISERLSNEKCKAIMCWNNASYDELIRTIDCSKFKDKIHVIPFAGDTPKSKKEGKKEIVFLFVSSINNPVAFNTKGGFIALEAYSKLAKKYKNIKFLVRANINKEIIKKYKNISGLIFLTKYLSQEKMYELFSYSDILLVPIPGIDLFTKIMEFGIPAICFDYGVAYEIVIDKKTGFLIDSSKIFRDKKNLKEHYVNLIEDYKKLSREEDYSKFVQEFVDKSEILINNKNLLKKMVKNQYSLVEKGGKYSLDKRNQKLKNLIDHSIN
jgi:glycosyltransferase involved in cell wall biosynthesis